MTPSLGRMIGGGELLDRTWDVIGRRFWALIAIVLPIQALATALDELTPLGRSDLPTWLSLLASLPAWILFGVAQMGITVIVWGELEGRRAGIGSAWRRMLVTFPAIALLQILVLILITAGFILLFVPGLWFGVAASLAPVVVALEQTGAWGAIGRSVRLVRGRWWHTSVLISLPALPLIPLLALTILLPKSTAIVWGLSAAAAALFTFYCVALTVIYRDHVGAGASGPAPAAAPAPALAEASPARVTTFRELEHAGWEEVATAYRTTFASLTGQAAEPLLDAVGAGPGTKLLDVASGPGVVAAAAAARKAVVTGIDFSAPMVEQARRLHHGIEFREGYASALPFQDSSFDAVTINFGMLHFDDPEQAVAEAFRVLRPGGRFAFTVWQSPEQAVTFGIVLAAIAQYGSADVPLPAGPAFFRFSDTEESARVLLEAGFVAPHMLQIPMTWRLGSGEEVFEAMRDATVRTRALLLGQTPTALQEIRRSVVEAAEDYRRGGGLELPMPALLATARRPEASPA